MTTGLKYGTKEAHQHKKKLKEKPNTPKKGEKLLNQMSTSNCYTTLLDEESEEKQQIAGPRSTPKHPPICITDNKNISPLIQLLGQIAIQQYEVKALAQNQVKVQPKIS
jgi:hypothetical protein